MPATTQLGWSTFVTATVTGPAATTGYPAIFTVDSIRPDSGVVLPPWIEMPAILTDPNGFGRTPTPVPADPLLVGGRIYGQYVVVDPNGLFFGVASMSNGLELIIGN